MMKKIVLIVGPSGSGKTTLIDYMNKEHGLPFVASYTTRAMRVGETDGVEHTFVTVDDMPDKSEMLAYTFFGGNHYWATHEQIKDIPTLYAIDEDGIRFFKEMHGNEYDILTVYIKRNCCDVDKERMDRDADRRLLDDSEYDLILNNNGDLESFLKISAERIKELLGYLV